MKKKYVKPQNRVVELKDKLMQGEVINPGSATGEIVESKDNPLDTDYDSDSSSDVWED